MKKNNFPSHTYVQLHAQPDMFPLTNGSGHGRREQLNLFILCDRKHGPDNAPIDSQNNGAGEQGLQSHTAAPSILKRARALRLIT